MELNSLKGDNSYKNKSPSNLHCSLFEGLNGSP